LQCQTEVVRHRRSFSIKLSSYLYIPLHLKFLQLIGRSIHLYSDVRLKLITNNQYAFLWSQRVVQIILLGSRFFALGTSLFFELKLSYPFCSVQHYPNFSVPFAKFDFNILIKIFSDFKFTNSI